jgi:hypothetical protein
MRTCSHEAMFIQVGLDFKGIKQSFEAMCDVLVKV